MKYRKVGGPVTKVASSSWNDSGEAATGSTGSGTMCALKIIKSHRTLPLNDAKPDVAAPTSTNKHQHSPAGAITPESKKQITEVKPLKYDNHVPVTSKAVVEDFYTYVMEQAGKEGEDGDFVQQQLTQVGLLSLGEVLLPAVAHEENCSLKLVQKKVQRDCPSQTYILKDARLAIIECLSEASVAVRESRLQREVLDQQREEQWKIERRAQREQERQQREDDVQRRRKEEAKLNEMEAIKVKRELKKKLPRNQELWREVAFLMTESSKLSKEERLWKEMESLLTVRENEMELREKEEKEHASTNDDVMMEEETVEEFKMDMAPFDQSVEEISESSSSILKALQVVSELVADSDKMRRELYRRYRKDHQFQGYRGVNDPKGLIRILSQDPDEMY